MLLGRLREQQALERLLQQARGGRSGVLALVGEPGIGKTALLESAASMASGMRILRARGVPSETQIPFAGLFELLRPSLGCLERIPRPQQAALESALALRPARAEDRFAVGAATLSLLAAYSESEPLALLIDDAHWLDGSSAGALLFALRRLLAEPVAAVLTARTGEPSVLDGTDLTILHVGGLEANAAEVLLRRQAPEVDAGTVARLHRESGGNPLALLELARVRLPGLAPDEPIPVVTSVSLAYVQRARALPERTQDALILAAAADRGDLTLIARAAAQLELTVTDLDPAEDSGLVSARDGSLEFCHPLARSAIYAAATLDTRRRVHRALAETLPDADADRRAWHLALAAAGPDELASSALAQAAYRAYARSAYDVSSQAFERAALLATTNERRASHLYRAADTAWLGGHAERAGTLLDASTRAAQGTALTVEIEHLWGHIALVRGPLREGAARLRRAAEEADAASAVVMLAEVVVGGLYAADAALMHECAVRARTLAGRDGSTQSGFFATIADGMALVMVGDGNLGVRAIRDAVELVERSDELRSDPRLLAVASMGPLWLREAGVGQALIAGAVEKARSRSAVGVLPHLLTLVGIQTATADRWFEANAAFDEAITLARETGQSVVLAVALARLAWLEARLGREDACREHAAEALGTARRHEVGLAEIWALAGLRDLELALGNADAALARAKEQQALIAGHEIGDPDLWPAPEQVELYLRLGQSGVAAAISEAFEPMAARKGQPWSLARAARCRALLAANGAYESIFEQALDLHARTPDLYERARTELAYGSALRRAGERTRARERLRGAYETFADLGAVPWMEAARVELAATGETARRREPSNLDELTPQELQVSLLLADGRTTREAAAALFLSPKTIEYHLRNAYRKLAVHSREDLREALHGTPPTPTSGFPTDEPIGNEASSSRSPR